MSGYPRVSIRLAVEVLLQGKLGHLHINIRQRHLLYLICHCDVMRASQPFNSKIRAANLPQPMGKLRSQRANQETACDSMSRLA